MTVLSINVNKIALLRNSRDRDYPSVTGFVEQFIALGVRGITVHPRPDERHVTRQDVFEISELLQSFDDVEFNIEGYPSPGFLKLVTEVRPAQCTLVPDTPEQLTSDHGWDVLANRSHLSEVLTELRQEGIRSSLFLDPDSEMLEAVPGVGADRVELYTEEFANTFGSERAANVFEAYRTTAIKAVELGLGVNAGHDLDLVNLPKFLEIPAIDEVSIGHALVVESLLQGFPSVIRQYLEITAG